MSLCELDMHILKQPKIYTDIDPSCSNSTRISPQHLQHLRFSRHLPDQYIYIYIYIYISSVGHAVANVENFLL
jgi:hypothetical protein